MSKIDVKAIEERNVKRKVIRLHENQEIVLEKSKDTRLHKKKFDKNSSFEIQTNKSWRLGVGD